MSGEPVTKQLIGRICPRQDRRVVQIVLDQSSFNSEGVYLLRRYLCHSILFLYSGGCEGVVCCRDGMAGIGGWLREKYEGRNVE